MDSANDLELFNGSILENGVDAIHCHDSILVVYALLEGKSLLYVKTCRNFTCVLCCYETWIKLCNSDVKSIQVYKIIISALKVIVSIICYY